MAVSHRPAQQQGRSEAFSSYHDANGHRASFDAAASSWQPPQSSGRMQDSLPARPTERSQENFEISARSLYQIPEQQYQPAHTSAAADVYSFE